MNNPSVAERLLDLGDVIRSSRGGIVFLGADDLDHHAAVFKLALRLRANPVLALRAVAEEWPTARIVREIY